MTFDREELARQEAELDELYREIILDHYRSPRNKGSLPSPTVSREGLNPLCGDEVRVDLAVADGVIADIRYDGRGCSISQSSTSMMTEAIKGRRLEEAETLFRQAQARDLQSIKQMRVDRGHMQEPTERQGIKQMRVGQDHVQESIERQSIKLIRIGSKN